MPPVADDGGAGQTCCGRGGIGAASLVASVPMITLGHLIMRDAYIVFNEENGIGLSVAL